MLLQGTAGKNLEKQVRAKTEEGVLVWTKEEKHWIDVGPRQIRPEDFEIQTWIAHCDGTTLKLEDLTYYGEPPHGKEKRSQVLTLSALSRDDGNPPWYMQPGPIFPNLEYRGSSLSDFADMLEEQDRVKRSKVREQEAKEQGQKIKKCLGTLGIDDPEILKMF
jgi:hypothetical protein